MQNNKPLVTPVQVNVEKPKERQYSLTRDEFLYVSEHNSLIQLNDQLVRRYIAAVVLERLKIDPKDKQIRVNEKGDGILVVDNRPKK